MNARIFGAAALLGLVVLVGCSGGDSAGEKKEAGPPLPSELILAAAPDGARPLSEVKASSAVGDEVTFKARIGGRLEPFVSSRAIMVVIDPSLPSCADKPGDACPVPWDYCCETPESLVTNTATVQVVDPAGKPLGTALQGHEGLNALAWITVVGKVTSKEDGGLFIVDASGIFVEKQGKQHGDG